MYIAESIIFFLPIPLNISYEIHYGAINSLDFLGDHKFLTCHISNRPPLRKRIHYIYIRPSFGISHCFFHHSVDAIKLLAAVFQRIVSVCTLMEKTRQPPHRTKFSRKG